MERSFLQSEKWMLFQKSLNRQVFEVGKVFVILHELPLGRNYLYCPHPYLSEIEKSLGFKNFLNEVSEIAEKTKAIFFKIEPFDRFDFGKGLLEKFNFIKSDNIQPKKTWVLDIIKSEEELLKQMHYKTRYNIQLAQRKGIKTRISKNKLQHFEDFWKLIQQTTKRDGFRAHSKEHYKKLLEIPEIELFVAEFNGKIIVANLVVFYEKTAIYLHGASDYQQRNLMAAPLLQWEQIKEAKRRGCEKYDFWGIDEKKWPGVTRFKKSFNGEEIVYLGAYDLIFRPVWYKIYKIAKRLI